MKISRYRIGYLSAGLALSCIVLAGAAAAAQSGEDRTPMSTKMLIDGRVAQGYDSNALRLSDTVGRRGGTFTDVQGSFTLDQKFSKRWFAGADLGVTARQYYGDVRDASARNYAARVSGGMRLPSLVAHHRSTLELGLAYRIDDLTYVDPSSGQVATSGGESIGERYDASTVALDAVGTVPVMQSVDLVLKAAVKRRNYRNDYDSLDLEPLDYTEYSLEPGIRWKGELQRARLTLPVQWRRFRDRRARDQAGNYLDGTDLAYRYYGVEGKYERALTQTISLEAQAKFQDRRDSEGGYYDRTRWSASLGAGIDVAEGKRCSADVAYSTLHYRRVTAGNEDVNEEQPDSHGWSVGTSYGAGLPIWDMSAFAQLRWDTFGSPTARSNYDRWQVWAGVRKGFSIF